VRRFSAEYLADTRAGLWEDASVLESFGIQAGETVLDVGCGTGSLTRALRAQATTATVIGIDADRQLLDHVEPPTVQADASGLPFEDRSVDLVTCQALLINMPDPPAVVREFVRVSCGRIAVVEPDNAAVAVESTAPTEAELARRAREAYVEGTSTDVTLGSRAAALLRDAGLEIEHEAIQHHHRTIEAPYSERDLEAARRKAAGRRLRETRETLLAGGLSPQAYDALLADWRAMGRTAIEQMERGDYRRAEVVPFHVVVARVPAE
jgi:SAM-dependent methyltransferase